MGTIPALFRLSAVSGLLLAAASVYARLRGFDSNFTLLCSLHLVLHAACAVEALRIFAAASAGQGVYGLACRLAVAASLLFVLAAAMLPVTARDALIYHLAVPKFWLASGGISEIAWHEWSYFPLLLSTAYAQFLAWHFPQGAALYHAAYLPMAGAAALFTARFFIRDRRLPVLGFVILTTTPLWMRISAEPMADMAAAYWFGAGLACTLLWLNDSGGKLVLAAAGVLFGLALSCKYNPLLAGALSMPVFFVLARRSAIPRSRAAVALTMVVLVSTAVYAAWPAANVVWSGNPVHPFLASLFNPEDAAHFKRISPLAYRLAIYGESVFDVILLPVRMILAGADGSARRFDGVLTPLYLLIFAAPFVRPADLRRRGLILLTFMLVAAYFIFNLFLFDTVTRYQSPLLVLHLSLLLCGVEYFADRLSAQRRSLFLLLLLAVQLFAAVSYGTAFVREVRLLDVLTGKLPAEHYLLARLPTYAMEEYINATLPPEAKVYLCFTGNRYFYLERRAEGAYFCQDLILSGLGRDGDDGRLYELFKAKGVTHVMLAPRLLAASVQAFTPEQQAGWRRFVQDRLTLRHRTGGIELLEIRE